MKKYAVLLTLLFVQTSLRAQEGYNLTIQIENVPDKVLYLAGFYGENAVVFDSAKVKSKHKVSFKSAKRVMPSGIYWLVNKDRKVYLELLIDKSRHFVVKTSMEQLGNRYDVLGSEENILFQEYQLRSLLAENKADLAQEFIERSPESLLAKYLKATHFACKKPDAKVRSLSDDDTLQFCYDWLSEHYFDHLDLTDERLLHTPIQIDIEGYFRDIVRQHSDTLKKRIDWLVSLTDSCVATRNYCLQTLYYLFNDDSSLGKELLVYMYDNYCQSGTCDWLDYTYARVFKRQVERMRRLLPNASVPPLESYDLHGDKVSTNELDRDFIVLWLWDPDCDDCVELTPKLYEFYEQNRDRYNFEVYAVSITEDVDRWRNLIDEEKLDWVNTSYGQGEPNYDFADYFDVMTTPGIFLLRKNHTMVASQFPIEELQDYLQKEMLNLEN